LRNEKIDRCHVVDKNYALKELGWSQKKVDYHNWIWLCETHHGMFDNHRTGWSKNIDGTHLRFEPNIAIDYIQRRFIIFDERQRVERQISSSEFPENPPVHVYKEYCDWKNARCRPELVMKIKDAGLPFLDPEDPPAEVAD